MLLWQEISVNFLLALFFILKCDFVLYMQVCKSEWAIAMGRQLEPPPIGHIKMEQFREMFFPKTQIAS